MLEAVIETENLTKKFGDLVAVDNLNLKVPKGSIFGFLGPNGAGKTTTIKMLLGILFPTAGSAKIFRKDIRKDGLEIRKQIGYVSETQAMYGYMSVSEIINFCKGFYPTWDDHLVEKYLTLFELPLNKRVRELSRGMKTKLALLLALGPNPPLLILDEPTTGLDPIARHEFLTTIVKELTEAERTIFFSSHILNDVERIADWVGIINKGKLVKVSPMEELKLKEKRVRVVFQKEIEPTELNAIPGVTKVEREERGYLLTVDGDVNLVLTELQKHPLFALEVIDLNLEDIFMEEVKGDEK